MGVLILGGTTAAGKSDLAVELSQTYGAAIVSADAMTVYRWMNIGTAKPSADILQEIPHGAVNVADPDEDFSVADFAAVFEDAQRANDHVLVVGGTPFYLSALVRPLADMPKADPAIRAQLETLESPHERLQQVDPQSAARLHPNDRMRVIRALEVHAISGLTMTQLHARGGRMSPVQASAVWLDTDALDERIEARLMAMVDAGYVDEVAGLLEAGWSSDLKPMRSFGYRHLVDHVQGEIDLDEALRRTGRDTRRFARKQRTWARGLGWSTSGRPEVLEAASRAFAQE